MGINSPLSRFIKYLMKSFFLGGGGSFQDGGPTPTLTQGQGKGLGNEVETCGVDPD